MTFQLLLVGLVMGSLYALVAVSLNLIYGTMRLLNIGHGDMVMVGAYVGYWTVAGLGLSPIVGYVLAPLISGAIGLLLFRTLFLGLLRRVSVEGLESASLLIFFGVSMVLQNGMSYLFSGTPRAYNSFETIIRVGDVAVSQSRLVALGASAVLLAAVVLFLRFTIWGLGIRALIQSREASAIVGIDVDAAFTLSSIGGFALAGAAGAVIGTLQAATPFMGGPYTIIAFLVVIIGGLGNVTGSLFGGLLIGFLETVGVAITGPNYRDLLVYGLFILVLLLRPQGLFSKRASV